MCGFTGTILNVIFVVSKQGARVYEGSQQVTCGACHSVLVEVNHDEIGVLFEPDFDMAIQVLGAVAARGAVGSVVRSGARASASSAVSGLDIKVESNLGALTKALDVVRKDSCRLRLWGFEDTAFIVRNTIVEDTFPRSFNVKNKRFAGATFRVDKANKRKLEARVFDRLGKDFLAARKRRDKKTTRQQCCHPD